MRGHTNGIGTLLGQKDLIKNLNTLITHTNNPIQVRELIHSMSPSTIVVMMYAYQKTNITNINSLCRILGLQYSYAHNLFKILLGIEFLSYERNGRISTYTITKKGIEIMDTFYKKVN